MLIPEVKRVTHVVLYVRGHQLEVFCQLVPSAGGAAIAELTRNQDQAHPTTLEALFE